MPLYLLKRTLAYSLQIKFGQDCDVVKARILLENFVAHNVVGIYRIDNIHRTIAGSSPGQSRYLCVVDRF